MRSSFLFFRAHRSTGVISSNIELPPKYELSSPYNAEVDATMSSVGQQPFPCPSLFN